MSADDPNMPKWALDPLLTETSPLRGGGGGSEGHGALNGGGGGDRGGVMDDRDSDGEFDSDLSDDDLGRYPTSRGVPRGCLLDTLMLVNIITCLTAIGVAATQALVLSTHKELSPESIAVRCYTILFCFLIIFAELEWTSTVREMFALHSWIPRGILYSFVGVLVLEEEDEKGLDLGEYTIYITIISWTMVGIGGLYFVMGICCIQRMRDKRRKRYKELIEHYENTEALRRDHDAIA